MPPARSLLRAARIVAAALAVAASAASTARAQLGSLGVGSRAVAMGNAYTAVADDLAAVYYNPAGLTQLIDGRADAMVGIGLDGVRLSYRQPIVDERSNLEAGGQVGVDDEFPDWIVQPVLLSGLEIGDHVYATPFTILVPFAGATQFSETRGDARWSATEIGQMAITWSPSIAVRVTDFLSLAAGPDLVVANDVWQKSKLGDGAVGRGIANEVFGDPDAPLAAIVSTENGIDDGDTLLVADEEAPTGLGPVNDVNLDFRNWGFHAALLFTPTEWLRIGALYRSALAPDVEGSIQNRFEPAIEDDALLGAFGLDGETERFRLELPLPATVSVGIAVRPDAHWLLAAAWWWEDWREAGGVDVIRVGGDGLGDTVLTPVGMKELRIPRGVQSSPSQARVGVEWCPVEVLAVRGGFWYAPSAIPDAYWDFASDPGDRFAYSGGLGLRGLFDGMLDVDTHLQWTVVKDRHIQEGESRIAGGSREVAVSGGPSAVPNDGFSVVVGGYVVNAGLSASLRW